MGTASLWTIDAYRAKTNTATDDALLGSDRERQVMLL
jgi:hypothetical protein